MLVITNIKLLKSISKSTPIYLSSVFLKNFELDLRHYYYFDFLERILKKIKVLILAKNTVYFIKVKTILKFISNFQFLTHQNKNNNLLLEIKNFISKIFDKQINYKNNKLLLNIVVDLNIN